MEFRELIRGLNKELIETYRHPDKYFDNGHLHKWKNFISTAYELGVLDIRNNYVFVSVPAGGNTKYLIEDDLMTEGVCVIGEGSVEDLLRDSEANPYYIIMYELLNYEGFPVLTVSVPTIDFAPENKEIIYKLFIALYENGVHTDTISYEIE